MLSQCAFLHVENTSVAELRALSLMPGYTSFQEVLTDAVAFKLQSQTFN